MVQQRRTFIKSMGSLAGISLTPAALHAAAIQSHHPHFEKVKRVSSEDLATDEDFWYSVRQAYPISHNFINLNNGGVSPHPTSVHQSLIDDDAYANKIPGFNMWRRQGPERETVRIQLADLAGCDRSEVAILRNTTEALDTVMLGLNLRKGDEIITSDQAYSSMLSTLNQLERRYGVVVKKIKIPVPLVDNEEVTRRFEAAMTRKTRLILVCHMVSLSGEILPIKSISDSAHQKGIEVLVDGAHTFAHLDFNIPDLGCDYFGTSLHKWLCGPFGTGMLYVKKEKIAGLWPLFGAPEGEEGNITKFEHLGTRSFPTELAIGKAIDFHNGIGAKRKQARLNYLKTYWTDKAKEIPGFVLQTNPHPDHSCAITNFSIAEKNDDDLGKFLFVEHRIYNTITRHEDIKGIRISPNVYTTLRELDTLVKAIHEFVKIG